MPKKMAGKLVLLSSSLLSFVLGSVHAFSVFLEPLEQMFGASRSTVSMVYSITLVSLTIAVLLGHAVFSKLRPSLFVVLVCGVAAGGALLSASATSLTGIWLGYGLIFGAANGFGYAYGLQMSAQANPGREGVAMGVVTACYALGATIAPPLFSWAVSLGGFPWAMIGLAVVLVAIAPVCAALLWFAGAQFQSDNSSASSQNVSGGRLFGLWLGYGAGVAAGLMAIGHATGIAKSAGLQEDLWIAPMIIAVFNMIGSFAGGWLTDRVKLIHLLAGLSLVSAMALVFLVANKSIVSTLFGLGIIGLTYGALIAAYPAAISKLFGVLQGTRIYGRVFTAWGAAGLLAPWLAGILYDRSGGYSIALAVAATMGIVSTVAILSQHRIQTETSDR